MRNRVLVTFVAITRAYIFFGMTGIVVGIAMASCAPTVQTEWSREGARPDEAALDLYICERSATGKDQSLVTACMMAHGWHLAAE